MGGRFDTQIILNLLVDIAKGWRNRNALIHRKTQSMCLTITALSLYDLLIVMIWILTNNHHFDLLPWAVLECIENIGARWKDCFPALFF